MKILEVMMDNMLSYGAHVEYVIKRAAGIQGSLRIHSITEKERTAGGH